MTKKEEQQVVNQVEAKVNKLVSELFNPKTISNKGFYNTGDKRIDEIRKSYQIQGTKTWLN